MQNQERQPHCYRSTGGYLRVCHQEESDSVHFCSEMMKYLKNGDPH
jgi:hypothetical protein